MIEEDGRLRSPSTTEHAYRFFLASQGAGCGVSFKSISKAVRSFCDYATSHHYIEAHEDYTQTFCPFLIRRLRAHPSSSHDSEIASSLIKRYMHDVSVCNARVDLHQYIQP